MDKWRKEKLAQGLCGQCGKNPHIPNMKECKVCKEKRVSRQKEKYESNKKNNCEIHANKRKKFKDDGLCSRCGKIPPIENKLTCQKCLIHLKSYHNKVKDIVYASYGGYECSCCKEKIKQFLTLDHINNDGAEHRRKNFKGRKSSSGSGISLYRWLIRHNFPDTFQVLCMNCNWGKRMNNGICPHKNLN